MKDIVGYLFIELHLVPIDHCFSCFEIEHLKLIAWFSDVLRYISSLLSGLTNNLINSEK